MSDITKKPANLRANVRPTDGFVLSVDGKLKTQYSTADQAMAAGSKLKGEFPAIQVAIFNAAEQTYTPI